MSYLFSFFIVESYVSTGSALAKVDSLTNSTGRNVLRLDKRKRQLVIYHSGINSIAALKFSGNSFRVCLAEQADKMTINKLLLNNIEIKAALLISSTLLINSPVYYSTSFRFIQALDLTKY